MFAILLLLACVSQPSLALTRKQYDGYKVLSMIPVDEQALSTLHHLMLTDVNVDFWLEPSHVGAEVHMMVPPEHLARIESILGNANIAHGIHVDNVQDRLTVMWNTLDSRTTNAFDINDYNTLDAINSWLDALVGSCRSGLTCEVYKAGDSLEGRPIKAFKISKPEAGRKAYFIDATTHAREWIATATTLKILNHLVTGGDADAVALTDAYDWYFLPMVNPDGYEYTWNSDRLWRKNRRTHDGSFCFGVDINRNFDFRWATEGVGFNPCGEIFGGDFGGSEPETATVQSELIRLAPTLIALLTVHSYGNSWLFPWGSTIDFAGEVCERTDDFEELKTVCDATINAIQATNNDATWKTGTSCEVFYAVSGSTQDYAKGVLDVKHAYTPELRGDSYVIDASEIPLSFNEIWNGIVAMSNAIGS